MKLSIGSERLARQPCRLLFFPQYLSVELSQTNSYIPVLEELERLRTIGLRVVVIWEPIGNNKKKIIEFSC